MNILVISYTFRTTNKIPLNCCSNSSCHRTPIMLLSLQYFSVVLSNDFNYIFPVRIYVVETKSMLKEIKSIYCFICACHCQSPEYSEEIELLPWFIHFDPKVMQLTHDPKKDAVNQNVLTQIQMYWIELKSIMGFTEQGRRPRKHRFLTSVNKRPRERNSCHRILKLHSKIHSKNNA